MTERLEPALFPATELRARISQRDRDRRPYLELPFDMPAGARAVRVALETRELDGGTGGSSIVDLGLFGPGPLDPRSFRGWSGSERSEVVVGELAATPGYRPGRLEPGRWHVLLGLYRIAPAGCEVIIRISEPAAAGHREPAPREPAAGRRGTGPRGARRAPGWLPCDLHVHSHHSDGSEPLAGLVSRAAAAGLRAVAITDHNTDSHLLEARARPPAGGVTIVPGEEVTTYAGHFSALGIGRWVDFRIVDAADLVPALAAVHAAGGIVSVNHPADPVLGWGFGDAAAIDAVEVWNGPWSPADDRALEWWAALASPRRRIVAVGGSDSHGPGDREVGRPTTWVRSAGRSGAAIVAAIRAGRAAITRGPDVRPPELATDSAGGIGWRVRDAAGCTVTVIVDGTVAGRRALASPDEAGIIEPGVRRWQMARLEVRDRDGALVAINNPCWREDPG